MWTRRCGWPGRCAMPSRAPFISSRSRPRFKASHVPALIKTGGAGALLLAAVLSGTCAAENAAHIPLRIGRHAFQVEVAATPIQREHGLMGRTRVPANGGMLFVFRHAGRHCFWMRNTRLPLSIAFIDDGGRIASLDDMQALSDTPHCPETDVRYALEIAQGGFKRRGIVPGAKVNGLPP
jgi:uncharacterized membrane protein (UPF0127 family)